jgi:predicted phosphodiesterase
MSKTVVGVIGDTHEPFCHKDYRNFCYETFNKFKVTRVVHIGDEADNHALSYHEHNPNGMSAESEAERAMGNLEKWYKTFPNVDILVGNHSALPYRQATTAGIPKRFLKTYEEVWHAPKGWKWHDELEIDHVKYVHGIGSSGQNGAINRALRARQSTVIGHIHSFGGVNYHANENDIIFGLNVGCGIDTRAYAFEYGKPFVNKPTLGCGIVTGGQQGFFIPMSLGKKYEWKK